MDLTYVVDGIKKKLFVVECDRLWNENDIHSASLNSIDLRTDLQKFKGNVTQNLKEYVENKSEYVNLANARVHNGNTQLNVMNERINGLVNMFNQLKNETTTQKKDWLWAEMPAETQTLPNLLEHLKRPGTL
jgi:hypothetical protein